MQIRKKSGKEVELVLGDKVKDRISGFEGIVESITDFIAGCRRIRVSSTVLHEGRPIDDQHFDEPNLEIVDQSVIKPVDSIPNKFKLGDEVKCSVTGFKGIATSRTKYLVTVEHLGVTPSAIKDGKPAESYSFPTTILEKVVKQKIKENKVDKPTGGDQRVPVRRFGGNVTMT